MNINEEKNLQRMMNVLDALELEKEDLEAAKAYMDPEQKPDLSLLKKLECRDYSQLAPEKRRISMDYVSHLQKRNREDELKRYLTFTAESGGSTAGYLWDSYLSSRSDLFQYVRPEQEAAILAERIAWNSYLMNAHQLEHLFELGKSHPQVLYEAWKLCYHKSDNAKVLISGIYLHCAKKGGAVKTLVFGMDSNTREILHYLLAELKEEERIYKNKPCGSYLVQLFSATTFLAIEHDRWFSDFFAMLVKEDWKAVATRCAAIAGEQWFSDHEQLIEKNLPVPVEEYIKWLVENGCRAPLVRLAKSQPEAVWNVAAALNTEQYDFLMGAIKSGNSALHRQLDRIFNGDMDQRLAKELTERLGSNSGLAARYLMGEAQLEDLYPYAKEWGQGYEDWRVGEKIKKLARSSNQLMYRRVVTLHGLAARTTYFRNHYGEKRDHRVNGRVPLYMMEKDIRDLVNIWETMGLPLRYQLDALAALYEAYYFEEDKEGFAQGVISVMTGRGVMDEIMSLATSGSGTVTALSRYLAVRIMDQGIADGVKLAEEGVARLKTAILACAMDSSKVVREQVVKTVASHSDWEADAKKLLASKKSQERETAVQIIKAWGAEKFKSELEAALEAEKSKKIKEQIVAVLGLAADAALSGGTTAGAKTPEEIMDGVLKGGKKRKVEWAFDVPFPEVRRTDGSPATVEYMQALLVSYADMTVPGVSVEGKLLGSWLEPSDLALFMTTLFDRWLAAGAEAKKKWVLYAVSIHGGEAIVPVMYRQIQLWPDAARGAIAAEAVRALALNGSPAALLQVDQIARKFKFRQVKVAAGQALTFAAEQLGISRDELEDRIVPNLGFDETMERIFDYGPRKFRVVLMPSLELEIFNDDGKKVKSMPAPGAKDDPELSGAASDEFKALKKQLKTVVATQKLRLEQALSAERLWTVERWKALFVTNPVMHQFATGLIWGIYETAAGAEASAVSSGGLVKLSMTFRYMEDGTFNTVDEDEYELPETGLIGLVHPVELTPEELAAWKEQLSDYEVTQPFDQLTRPVYQVEEGAKDELELTTFGGKLLNGLSLSGKLQGMGWYRGSVQDGGCYYDFYREDGAVGAEVEMSGLYVGGENDEVIVYGVKFYKSGTVKRGSYVYDEVKKENIYPLGTVSPRYFSEIVLQMTKATASSQEQLNYPRCRERGRP